MRYLAEKRRFYDECHNLVKYILEKTTHQNKNMHINKTYVFQTPLCEACAGNALKNAMLLLHHGAKPNKGSPNSSPLKTAIKHGNVSIIALLANHKDIKINDQDEFEKNSPLIEAVTFISINRKPCKSIPYKKYKNLRTKIVLILLKAQANPYLENINGENAIHVAQKNGFYELARLMENPELCKNNQLFKDK